MTLGRAILATLAYHDIFDYPLTQEEIHKYLIGNKSSLSQIQTELTRLRSANKIGERRSYFYLKNHGNIVNTRIQRTKYSKKKYKKAVLFANILKVVPTMRLVAVSGALAMQNSDKEDDIDLAIICAKNTLWTTRFLANLILMPFKRYPKSKLTRDRACLNIFIDESDLTITAQNIYTAHEICQMRPIWSRDNTYSRFIRGNQWIYQYLPNWTPQTMDSRRGSNRSLAPTSWVLAEKLFKKLQLSYMRSRITSERIGEHQLFFHPSNTQEWVLEEYQGKLKKLNLV